MVRPFRITTCLIGGLFAVAGVRAADAPMDMAAGASQQVRHWEAIYKTPSVSLVRDDGKRVAFGAELDDGRPVVMNFIFTSCTTICPMSSQLFEWFQKALGVKRETMHLVSISIDPEEDTPARLRAYAKKFHAERGWDHYTGTAEAILAVQDAFSVDYGEKMRHTPLTLMRSAPGQPWVRFDGFATTADLLAESKKWRPEPGLARAAQ
jgi:protein SCO1/2